MKLPFGIELKRDTNYYLGLGMLTAAIFCIVWAIWRDAFDARDFLVYFLIYSWGYVLLLKSDFELRTGNLEKALIETERKLAALTAGMPEKKAESPATGACGDLTEDFLPGLPGENAAEKSGEIYHEWKGEE